MGYVSNTSNWKRTHKKQYEVYMCRPKIGTVVVNKFEGSKYVTDNNKQFVLSGTCGEQWVIDAAKMAKTYVFANGERITPSSLRSRMLASGEIDWIKLKTITDENIRVSNWALFLPLNNRTVGFPVNTSWGDVLYANRSGVSHGKGDFLVCSDDGGRPNLKDVWVVNGNIFATTYDMRAFPGHNTSNNNIETPKPRSIVSGASSSGYDTSSKIKAVCSAVQEYCKHGGCKASFSKDGSVINIDIVYRNRDGLAIKLYGKSSRIMTDIARYINSKGCYTPLETKEVHGTKDVVEVIHRFNRNITNSGN